MRMEYDHTKNSILEACGFENDELEAKVAEGAQKVLRGKELSPEEKRALLVFLFAVTPDSGDHRDSVSLHLMAQAFAHAIYTEDQLEALFKISQLVEGAEMSDPGLLNIVFRAVALAIFASQNDMTVEEFVEKGGEK